MAMKAMHFLLAFVLLVTTRVLPFVEAIDAPEAPAHPTEKHHAHGCHSMCEEYCKKDHHKKKECKKACMPCCDKCKCVPEHKKNCSNWDQVKMDGKFVECS